MDACSTTRRAVLADVCRGRPRRPLSLLRPRFVQRGVVVAIAPHPPTPTPTVPPPAVLFDEVAYDVACEGEGGGCSAQHLRTVPMWVARPASAAASAMQGAEGPRPLPPPLLPTPPTPPTPPLPAVLWLHGKTESRDTYLPEAERLARRGCIAAVPDMPHHGGRRRETRHQGASASASASAFAGCEFEAAVAGAVRSGKAGPLVLDWAWDALCALDALQALYGRDDEQDNEEEGWGDGGRASAEGGSDAGGDEHSRLLTRAEVRAYRRGGGADDRVAPGDVTLDPARVALAGSSMGGSAALLATLVADAAAPGDDASRGGGRPVPPRRVAACAPFIALQYWGWGLLDDGGAWLGRAESLTPAFQAAIEAAAAAGRGASGRDGDGDGGRPSPPRSSSSCSRCEAWEQAVRRLLPGMLDHYDAPHALAALRAAGVPLLACNSASDTRCPIAGVEQAWREAEEAEEAEEGATGALTAAGGGAAGRELFVDPSARGHELTPPMLDRFEAWLGEIGLLLETRLCR